MGEQEGIRRRDLAVAATGALALLTGCGGDEEAAEVPTSQLGAGDLRVLDFALGLERLEASFYERILERDVLRGRARALAREFLEDERAHARVIEELLREGGVRRSEPLDVDVGRLVGDGAAGTLATAVKLEETGAAAYLGQLGEINDRSLLAGALSIHSVEGRHAARWRRLLGRDATPAGAFATPLERPVILRRLGDLVA